MLGRGSGAKEICLFALAVIRPQTYHVALVAHRVNQFVVAEKTADGRVLLPNFFPGLDRHRDVIVVAKLKAYDGMCDPGRAPVGDKNIHAPYLRKVKRSSLPMRGVFAFGAVVAVADVVNGHVIAVYFRPGGLRYVGLPGPVIRGLQG